jgi:hypothetical protein
MAKVAQMATIIAGQPGDDAPEIMRNAWLLWNSVTREIRKERKPERTASGDYIYRKSFRGHVIRLWPMLSGDEQRDFERELYTYLRQTTIARCVRPTSPPVWHVSATWKTPSQTAVVIPVRTYRAYQPTSTERRLTPEEVGEHLPVAPVTIKRKDDMSAAATAPEATESDVRKELIIELISDYQKQFGEPLESREIAHATSIEISSVRKELKALVETGKLYSRIETIEERKARYGGEQPRAMPSTLYSTRKQVPERKTWELVPGVKRTAQNNVTTLSSAEVEWRLARLFAKLGAKAKVDSQCVTEKARIPLNTVRSRLRVLCEEGYLKQAGFKNQRQQYQVLDKEKLLERLNYRNQDEPMPKPDEPVIQPPAPPQPAEPTPTLQPHSDGPPSLEEKIVAVLDDNERLRQRVAELEAYVEELTRPNVSADVAARLMEWTPST